MGNKRLNRTVCGGKCTSLDEGEDYVFACLGGGEFRYRDGGTLEILMQRRKRGKISVARHGGKHSQFRRGETDRGGERIWS